TARTGPAKPPCTGCAASSRCSPTGRRRPPPESPGRRHQAKLVGDDHEVYPVPGVELGEQPCNVRLGGGHTDDELVGDLAVGQAAPDEGEHVLVVVDAHVRGLAHTIPGMQTW